MTRIIPFVVLLVTWNPGAAQDLVITNARIIDGTGATIDQGSVVVSDGRIVSVSAGASEAQAVLEIDAQGMTVMPGMIDTHVHVLIGSAVPASEAAIGRWVETELPEALIGYLAAGLTTVVSTGDFFDAILTVRDRLEKGELMGPRLLTAGPLFTAPGGHPSSTVCRSDPLCVRLLSMEVADPGDAREGVRKLAQAGVDSIAVTIDSVRVPVAQLDLGVLTATADEAKRLNVPTIAHIQTTQDALKAAEAGVTRLAHMPSAGGVIDRDTAIRVFRTASIPVSSTAHAHAPVVDATGTRRDHRGGGYTAEAEARMTENLTNVRRLWDAGVIVAFATDQSMGGDPSQIVMHEIETLSQVLSPQEIITSLTRNAAEYLDLGDEIGTLEPDKLADIVMIDGDPLSDIADLANVEVVISDGRIVVDNR